MECVWLRSVVILGDNDQASRAFEYKPRIQSALIVQILHLTRITARKPFPQVRQFHQSACGCHATQVETLHSRLFLHPTRLFTGCHANNHALAGPLLKPHPPVSHEFAYGFHPNVALAFPYGAPYSDATRKRAEITERSASTEIYEEI